MVSILLSSIGITFLILSVMVFVDKVNLLRYGIRTEGEVIGFKKCTQATISEGKEIIYMSVYKPIIRFKTEVGEYRTFIYENTQNSNFYRIGDRVKLIYPAGDLDSIEINEKNVVFKLICKLITIGIIFIIFGLILSLV